MSDLANIIKNIDPPIELTSTQYNSLSQQQKNNGLYYVGDSYENGISQDASVLLTNNSNTQAELNNLNSINENILSGQQSVQIANNLITPHERGFYTDTWGNFVHQTSTATNCWSLGAYGYPDSSTVADMPLRVWFETGRIVAKNDTYLVWGKGDTFNHTIDGFTGLITSSGTLVNFEIPIMTSASSVSITKISNVYIENNNGGHCYMKYSNGYVSLSNATIWENSAQKYANSIKSVAATIRENRGLAIGISFVTRLASNSSGSTNMLNNVPVGISLVLGLTFS